MEALEILSINNQESEISIVDGGLFIGSSDPNSDKPDISVQWIGDDLEINGYKMTPAMVKIIQMYLAKQF